MTDQPIPRAPEPTWPCCEHCPAGYYSRLCSGHAFPCDVKGCHAAAPEPTATDDLPENIAPSVWRLDADDLQREIEHAIRHEYDLADPDGRGFYPAPEPLAAAVMAVVAPALEAADYEAAQLALDLDKARAALEAAQAENERLRRLLNGALKRGGEHRAAVERVRALCDDPFRTWLPEGGNTVMVRLEDIRAALDGEPGDG